MNPRESKASTNNDQFKTLDKELVFFSKEQVGLKVIHITINLPASTHLSF